MPDDSGVEKEMIFSGLEFSRELSIEISTNKKILSNRQNVKPRHVVPYFVEPGNSDN